MPPKKKDSEAAVPSASLSLPPEQTGGGVDAGGRMGVDEGTLNAAKSKDKADGAATSEAFFFGGMLMKKMKI